MIVDLGWKSLWHREEQSGSKRQRRSLATLLDGVDWRLCRVHKRRSKWQSSWCDA